MIVRKYRNSTFFAGTSTDTIAMCVINNLAEARYRRCRCWRSTTRLYRIQIHRIGEKKERKKREKKQEKIENRELETISS